MKLLYPLFLLSIFITSCNGQVKTPDSIKPQTNKEGHPKLVKTQGSSPSDNIRCGLQDKAGNIWFGTTGEGVYYYDGNLFRQFTINDGLNSNFIWSILEDKIGNIWFCTDSGINLYNGKTISTISIPITVSNGLYQGVYTNNIPAENNEVFSIIQDKNGIIWFGTTLGIYCYDGKTFTRFLDNANIVNKSGISLNYTQCMLEDKNGNIWFGSGPMAFEGISLYDGKSITNFKPKNETWIRNMFEDKNGTIWFGTRHYGTCCYDGKNFTFFTEKEGIGTAMLEDKAGNIWFSGEEKLGTVESVGGIWRYDGKNFKNFTANDGLGNYFVWSIMEDKSGNIWIGTRNTCLFRYDGKTFTDFSDYTTK